MTHDKETARIEAGYELTWFIPEDVSPEAGFVSCSLCTQEAYFFGLEALEQPPQTKPPKYDRQVVCGLSDGEGVILICENCVEALQEIAFNRGDKGGESMAGLHPSMVRFINCLEKNNIQTLADNIGQCCRCEETHYLTGLLITDWVREGKDNEPIINDVFSALINGEAMLGPASLERAAFLSIVARRYIAPICKGCEAELEKTPSSTPVSARLVCAGPPDLPGRIPVGEVMPRGANPTFHRPEDLEEKIKASLEYAQALAHFEEADYFRKRALDMAETVADLVSDDGKGPGGIYLGAVVRINEGVDYLRGVLTYVVGFGVAINVETKEEFPTYELLLPVIVPVEEGPVWAVHQVPIKDCQVMLNEPPSEDTLAFITSDTEYRPDLTDLLPTWEDRASDQLLKEADELRNTLRGKGAKGDER